MKKTTQRSKKPSNHDVATIVHREAWSIAMQICLGMHKETCAEPCKSCLKLALENVSLVVKQEG